MTKCIIIGGNGFIGSEVAPLLYGADRNLHVLGRSPRPSLPLPLRMTYHQADYADRETLRSLLEPGCEVINLAYSTVPKTSYDDPLHDLLSNLPANVALLEECQAAKIGKLVMVSSGGTVYGSAISLPIREDAVTLPVSPYGISKLSTDLYTLMLQRNTGLPAVVVRPANAYGESQLSGKGQGFIAEAIDAVLEKREIGIYGVQGTIRDYIHVSGAVYNIGTGRGTSNLEIIEILRQLASSEQMEVRHQIRAARIFDVEANVLDSESLQRISGWKPRIPVDEGIRRVWESRLSGRGV